MLVFSGHHVYVVLAAITIVNRLYQPDRLPSLTSSIAAN